MFMQMKMNPTFDLNGGYPTETKILFVFVSLFFFFAFFTETLQQTNKRMNTRYSFYVEVLIFSTKFLTKYSHAAKEKQEE